MFRVQHIAQQSGGGEVGFDQHDGVVEIFLIGISEGRVSENGRCFEYADLRMAAKIVKESGKTAAGIADVSADAEYGGVAPPERVRILPWEIFIEIKGQMRIYMFTHPKSSLFA